MSLAPSRARSRSKAPSYARGSVVISPTPKPPIHVEIPPTPRPMSRGSTLMMDAPGLSGGRGMFKRLIVACDGTWLNSDNGMVNGKLSVPSNVTRISRAIKAVSQDGIPQIVNYHYGVGTQGGKFNRMLSGTTGEGLGDNVREAYSFLANNYHVGDEIFLIGFSRGAFTARSIAGLIGEIGLLTKKGLNSLPEVFEDVRERRNPKYVPKNPDSPFPNKPSANSSRYADELERRGLTRLDIQIKAIGVWDTVGSLGAPRVGWLTKVGLQSSESKEMSFYDTKLSPCIENAFQALALDERRSAFHPAVWEKPEGNRTTLRQVWFPGVHSNVGGGYDDQQLANITLAWMMSQLAPFLDMRNEYLFEQDDENENYYDDRDEGIRPWSFGEIYNSMSGLFTVGGAATRTPGQYYATDPNTGRPTDRPLRLTNEYIHASARTRIRLGGPGIHDKGVYKCPALTDKYKLVVDYGLDTVRSSEPDIHWKLKVRDQDSVRILPEAPLWGIEKEFARRDPETFDYIKRPPATGTSRERRKKSVVRPGSPLVESPLSPSARSVRSRRSVRSLRENDRFDTRKSFADDEKRERTERTARDRGSTVGGTASKHNKPRPVSFDERSSVVRDTMPHRRPKDKTWWEGVSSAVAGGGGGGATTATGMESGVSKRSESQKNPRRKSMRA
ncbi:hypothetical protein P280DRAFT_185668 [Massarina eburnea CBS 473.64]|uniref:T6SS Phospholipase effector Tle1-like catalytic domain-containing protein n=1 Tax=Massarina eburnea CBS 473.64 TaxID=1395130 RepID=A0A6A6SB48_9PLEO|nr:hypothetical protein P280DRAFT_185668 [Massarina eburnea CBS 473.64]